MKAKKVFLYANNIISPGLRYVWDKFHFQTCPKSVDDYIKFIDHISSMERNKSNRILLFIRKTDLDTENALDNLERVLGNLVQVTNTIHSEFRKHYRLTRKNKRILQRISYKNEAIWSKFNKIYFDICYKNDELYFTPVYDYVPFSKKVLKIPYKIKDFQSKPFQKN